MKYFWISQDLNSPELKGFPYIDGLGCAKFSCANNALSLHQHKGIEFHYIRNGIYEWSVEKKPYTVKKGDSFLTCPWQIHGSPKRVVNRGTYSWLIINPWKFTKNRDLYLGAWSVFSRNEERQIGRIMAETGINHLTSFSGIEIFIEQIYEELLHRHLGHRSRVEILIGEVILTVVREIQKRALQRDCQRPSLDEIRIESLIQKIRNNPEINWTLPALAGAAKLSIPTLKRTCSRYFGRSPYAMVQEIRMEYSIRRIKKQDPLIEIAFDAGFSSQQHFNGFFKKWTGYSPKQYQRKFLQIKPITASRKT
jgi:AraC-like DNA-binding protein